MRIKSISYILIAMLLLCVGVFSSGCQKKASDFTEEEHIQRISERIENSDLKWGYPDGESYQSFEVYPLYDQNDELKYFLVEFEPYGFVFIFLTDELPRIYSCAGVATSMYVRSAIWGKEHTWSPYIKENPENPVIAGDEDKRWILDENGKRIFYNKSPYFVTNNIQEKKYLLEIEGTTAYICAIKKDETFVNLVSGCDVNPSADNLYRSQAIFFIQFMNREIFDL